MAKEVKKAETKKEVKKVEPAKKTPVKKVEAKPVEKKTPAKKVEAKPVEKTAPAKKVETKPVEKKVETKKTYHLTYRQDKRQWQIILTHGDKAIKLFNTKAEAQVYLDKLADNQNANVSIKKKDGKFQKQK